MPSKSVTVQLDNKHLRQLEKVCEHYRWGRSQGVSEFIGFYHRLCERASAFSCHRALDGSETVLRREGETWVQMTAEDCERVLFNFVADVNAGMLAAFRPSVIETEPLRPHKSKSKRKPKAV